jgi:fructosamine-3-kinase
MTVPGSVQRSVEAALEERTGRATALSRIAPVGGGCINPSARLETQSGEAFFLKWNPSAPAEMFAAEADGLHALREGALGTARNRGPGVSRPTDAPSPRALHIPEVLGRGGSGTASDPGWLLLEWISQGSPARDYGRRLGGGLAALHASASRHPSPPMESRRPPTRDAGTAAPEGEVGEPTFGWHRDNFIGSLPQENGPVETWSAFWRDRRLEPQLRMARDRGYLGGAQGRVLDELLSRMEEVMEGAGASGPALLHGDLWSGNYYAGPEGEPVLIDPAVYRGTGEVDLAMMELFGSLPPGFLEGYEDVRRLDPAYDQGRRDLYQLYFLLVHVNLFGGSYVAGSLAAATRVLRSL